MSIVILNVGGTIFTTRTSTLKDSNSFFSGLINQNPLDSTLFVDRDPTHFRHVLNFLRGSATFPQQFGDLEELANEAEFYALPDFVSRIHARQSIAQKQNVVHQLSVIAARMG